MEVLVTTLKVHAAAINNTGVSVENDLVVMASEDKDVRVWGVSYECPVDVLRGNPGRSNIVIWSETTPSNL